MVDAVQQAVAGIDVPARVEMIVESLPTGTGGAVRLVMEQAGLEASLIANGDTFLGANLTPMQTPLEPDELLRLATIAVRDRARYDGVASHGIRVSSFVDNGRLGPCLINAGLSAPDARRSRASNPGQVVSMETEVMRSLAHAALDAAVIDGRFSDVGVPQACWAFCEQHGSAA